MRCLRISALTKSATLSACAGQPRHTIQEKRERRCVCEKGARSFLRRKDIHRTRLEAGLGNGRRNRKSVLIFGYFPELTITRR
jgi:hypothetical protein